MSKPGLTHVPQLFPSKKERRRKKEMLEYTLNTFDLFSSYTYSSLSSKTSGRWETLVLLAGFCRRKREKKSDILNLQEPRFVELKKCSKTLWEKAMHTISYKENLVFGMLYMCYYGPGISPWQHPSMHYISTQLNMAIKHTFQQKLGTYIIMVVNIFCKSS